MWKSVLCWCGLEMQGNEYLLILCSRGRDREATAGGAKCHLVGKYTKPCLELAVCVARIELCTFFSHKISLVHLSPHLLAIKAFY